MSRQRVTILAAVSVLLLAAGLVWAWKTWPARQLASAQKALAAGDYTRAEALLLPLLNERAEDPTVPYLIAQTLRHQNKYREAENALEKAVARGLDRASGMRELALLLAAQDWPAEAEGILQQVVRDHPEDREVLQTLAAGYARHGRWKEAVPLYSRLIERHPNEVEYLFQRGWVRMQDLYFLDAIGDFRQVLGLDPSHFLARLYLAHSLQSEARLAEAEVELHVCRKLRPDLVEPLVGLAHCAVEKGDLKAAEDWLGQAVALNGSSPLVLHEVVNLHLRRRCYDLAREVLELMARSTPQDKQVHLKLAQVYRRVGLLDQAALHQQRYQELDRLEEAQMRGMR
jgi:predicted Zn-dependent protease